MRWSVLQSIEATEQAGATAIANLRQTFAEQSQELLDLQSELEESLKNKDVSVKDEENNVNNNKGTTTTTTTAMKKTKKKALTLTLTAATGPHTGEVFSLYPKTSGKGLPVGRSQGKSYRTIGVSLKDDFEASTKHGVITRSSSRVYFTDLESTNGSSYIPQDQYHPGLEDVVQFRIDENVPTQLHDGDFLAIGATFFKIAISY